MITEYKPVCRFWRPAETVCDILFPAETTVSAILLPAKSRGIKQNHADSLGREQFIMHSCLGRKQDIADSLGGIQIWQTVSAGDWVIPCVDAA
ncbi:MAG: hypothetical protein AB2693_11835 [Candidatus Thiodiazotropha sp.]